jgi:hypothetical protein
VTQTTDQDYRRNLPRSWAETFGDPAPNTPMFTDPPTEPRKGSTADLMASRVRESERAARHDRNLAVVATAAEQDREDRALASALRKTRLDKPIPEETAALAARALDRHGVKGATTAERLAAVAFRDLAVPADDRRRRREGRRPR